MDILQTHHSFKSDILKFYSEIRKHKSLQIQSKNLKNKGKKLVQKYFRDVRHLLCLPLKQEQILKSDSHFQNLLPLTNADSSRSKYLSIMKLIKKEWDQLEVYLTSCLAEQQGHSPANQNETSFEKLVLSTLKKLRQTAYLSYKQALLDLRDTNRFSYKGTANEIRETLREVLDCLAPDTQVKSQPDFRMEKGQDKPTQKQKVHFILKQRNKSKQYIKAPEKAVGIIDNLKGDFARAVYSRSSALVHSSSPKNEVQKLKGYLDNVLAELLELHDL